MLSSGHRCGPMMMRYLEFMLLYLDAMEKAECVIQRNTQTKPTLRHACAAEYGKRAPVRKPWYRPVLTKYPLWKAPEVGFSPTDAKAQWKVPQAVPTRRRSQPSVERKRRGLLSASRAVHYNIIAHSRATQELHGPRCITTL